MKFERAMANVVMFQNEDVVTTSGPCCTLSVTGANTTWTCDAGHHDPIKGKKLFTSCGHSECTPY